MNTVLLLDKILAVAGGGGSSGGGGGGGGGGSYSGSSSYDGSSSGDGDPTWWLVAGVSSFIYMSIFLFVCDRLPKRAGIIVNGLLSIILSIVSLSILNAFSLLTSVWSCLPPIVAVLFALVISYSGAPKASKSMLRKAAGISKKAKARLDKASVTDKIWNQETMLQTAKETFLAYQNDWSNLNSQNMKNYLTVRYAAHAELMINQLKELGRHNYVKNVSIVNCHIGRVQDEVNDMNDTFTVTFEATADDVLSSDASGLILHTAFTEFTQYWTFVRSGERWLLDAINPATARSSSGFASLQKFSEKRQMFYSLDMGWLFIPKNGVLFKNGKFGTSDINNHIIGKINNYTVQLYTFQEDPSRNSQNYIVAQVAVPKSYGGIIVQRKKSFWKKITHRLPDSYSKYGFEWSDFNDRYEVFATDVDRLATFELLNPGFMSFLFNKDTDINIEVSDNTIFVYKEVESSLLSDYETSLDIIEKSFKELKL